MGDSVTIHDLSHASVVEHAASVVAERGAQVVRCANCEASTIGPYCAICGQERDTHRRSVMNLLKDFVIDLVNVDSRIVRTLLALLFQPGELACAFRQGRTQRYIPAMRLYLFTSVIFFLLLGATNIALVQFDMHVQSYSFIHDAQGHVFRVTDGKKILEPGLHADAKGYIHAGDDFDNDPDAKDLTIPGMRADGKTSNNVMPVPRFFAPIRSGHSSLSPQSKALLAKIATDETKKARKSAAEGKIVDPIFAMFEKLAVDPAALNGPVTTWLPRIMFLLLPAYAVLLMLFYFRKRRDFYFVDHLVFSLGIHTFGFVILMVAAAMAQVVGPSFVALGMLLVSIVYTFIAMKRFYRQGWFWTTVKFCSVSFLYVSFFALPAMIGAILLSIYGGSLG
jgi:hypothetical protein